MYKLMIDSSERFKKSVRLVKFTKGREELLGEKKGDIDLVSAIELLLEENDLKVGDIDEVIPNLGPGSFTGLKLGVTIANIINWSNGKKKINELYTPEYGSDPNIQLKEF